MATLMDAVQCCLRNYFRVYLVLDLIIVTSIKLSLKLQSSCHWNSEWWLWCVKCHYFVPMEIHLWAFQTHFSVQKENLWYKLQNKTKNWWWYTIHNDTLARSNRSLPVQRFKVCKQCMAEDLLTTKVWFWTFAWIRSSALNFKTVLGKGHPKNIYFYFILETIHLHTAIMALQQL